MANKYQGIVKRLGLEPLDEPVKLAEQKLADFESKLGSNLPGDFREFLSRYGFVSGVGVTFAVYGRPDQPAGAVEVFLGVDPDNEYDILSTREGLVGRLPDGLLPIAESPGGQICLALTGPDRGKVFWWGLESAREANEQPLLIANDFD